MSGLNWIQTVWHPDGIPERVDFEKKQQTTTKSMKNYQVGKVLL